ncbi:MAG: hypothetical protein H6662_04300 [Ardenticatenaceae bacterium]|nr:hypothetical protein [Ardenticatenaceae bacterium]MCB8989744.1 hypothetical protein [Ardenticatenaceae bacterium]MCB9002797.1 hypothetical protein [Ardenticatenaceae bacterium]
MTSNQQPTTSNQLYQAGFAAMLPGDLSLQAIVSVADALLASPVGAVEVALPNGSAEGVANTAALVADLRQRGRTHLLVGAAEVETPAQAAALIAAGAQWISSYRLSTTVHETCQQAGVFYLPNVIGIYAVQAALSAGLSLVRVPTGGPAGADYVKTLRETFSDVQVITAGDFTPEEVPAYVSAGVRAVFLGSTLFGGPQQPMANLITRARQFRQAWLESHK